ncbi:hypothetical protein IWZ03DRAFT_381373, partial [Phyllosticta citriasiana]
MRRIERRRMCVCVCVCVSIRGQIVLIPSTFYLFSLGACAKSACPLFFFFFFCPPLSFIHVCGLTFSS